MSDTDAPSGLDQQRRTFREALIEHGWLLTSPSSALPGLGSPATAVYDGLAAYISRVARQEYGAAITPVHFPHVFSVRMLEQTGYVASFPQLLGTIDSFLGGQKEFRTLLAAYHTDEDWQAALSPTGLALIPAACHPLYAWLEHSTVDRSAVYELTGDCFRHEPSDDPMRFVAFRMREYVRLGDEELVKEHRAKSLEVSTGILESLGLDVQVVAANDPFFGRGGVVLANNQRAAEAKFEVVAEVYAGTQTALASANYHDTHFGDEFSLTAADGTTAQSACSGYGMERIVLALARRHGFDLATWPSPVRSALGIAA